MSVPQEYSLSAELWTLTRRVGAVGLGRSIDAGIRLAITIALALAAYLYIKYRRTDEIEELDLDVYG